MYKNLEEKYLTFKNNYNELYNSTLFFEDSFEEIKQNINNSDEVFYIHNRIYENYLEYIIKQIDSDKTLSLDDKTEIYMCASIKILIYIYDEFVSSYLKNKEKIDIYNYISSSSNKKDYIEVEEFTDLFNDYEKKLIKHEHYKPLKASFKNYYTRYVKSFDNKKNQTTINKFLNDEEVMRKIEKKYVEQFKKNNYKVKNPNNYLSYIKKYLELNNLCDILRELSHIATDIDFALKFFNDKFDNFDNYIYRTLKYYSLNADLYFMPEQYEIEINYDNLLTSMRNMDYNTYLTTNHWRFFRSEAIKFYQKCKVCNSENNLHLHHSNYENIGRETFNDVVVLCQKCHKKFHNL